MQKQYFRFDENGYFIEPVIITEEFTAEPITIGQDEDGNDIVIPANPQPSDLTDMRPPDGMWRAKFTGSEWIETGEPPPQIPQPPSFQQIQAQAFAANLLGIEMTLTPQEQEVIATIAMLESPTDGTQWLPEKRIWLGQGTIVNSSGQNFYVIQGHFTQADWAPHDTPALFMLMQEDYAEWVQPQGTHDAYMQGDKVSFGGQMWVSDINNNVWQPGVHGWSVVD